MRGFRPIIDYGVGKLRVLVGNCPKCASDPDTRHECIICIGKVYGHAMTVDDEHRLLTLYGAYLEAVNGGKSWLWKRLIG